MSWSPCLGNPAENKGKIISNNQGTCQEQQMANNNILGEDHGAL